MRHIADRLILLSGWPALFVASLAGAACALGLAPVHFFPVLWITFPVLVLLLDGAVAAPESRGLRRLIPAFWRGYWFGFGYFVAGLWWMGSAFLVNADAFAWLMPLAVIGLPAFLAIFFGLAAAFARSLWTDGWHRIAVLAASLALFEWLRSTILTGFPWNHLGTLLAPNDVLMQAISVLGIHAYGFLAVLIFASPAAFFDFKMDGRVANVSFMVSTAVIFGLVISFGLVRLSTAEERFVEGVSLRVIQPNIPQKDKFKPEKAADIIRRYLSMSARSTKPGDLGLLSTTHLIWPESAFPFLLTEQPEVLAAIADLLPPGTTLLTGAVRAAPARAGETSRPHYNSLYTIAHNGEIKGAYDKVHLVPFGEYLPFEAFLEELGLSSLVELPGGFTPGSRRQLVKVSNAPPFLPLICYEIIFPNQVLDSKSTTEAEWILNVTNDAWFGITSGPHQHYYQARIRAVDEGLPVIRAANSGISAVIDGYGRVIDTVALDTPGIIDAKLPSKVALWLHQEIKLYIIWVFIISTFALVIKRVFSESRIAKT